METAGKMNTTTQAKAPASGMPDLKAIREGLTQTGAAYEVGIENVRGNTMPVFKHRFRSLGQLLEASKKFGDRTFIVDGDVRLSYTEHYRLVQIIASILKTDFAVKHGDRVAIFAANRWDWIVCFWAIVSVGGIPCGFNGYWVADEFAHAMKLVEPVLVIGDQPRLERIHFTLIKTPILNLDADLPRLLRDHRDAEVRAFEADEDEPALLLFTSGTTGRPKAVTMPHRTLIGFVQVNVFSEAMMFVAQGGPPLKAGDDLPPSNDIQLVTSPLFHTSMLLGAVLMIIQRGGSIVLLRGRFDPERTLEAIEKERVTWWSALGSAATRVATCPTLGKYDTSTIRRLGVGGATVSPTVQQRLREAFPSAASLLGMGYTSTEGGAVVASIGGPEYIANPTSTGRVTITTQIELRDPSGLRVPESEYGEVHVRSPYIMLGYWNNPEASKVLKDGGWLAMGDIAKLENGLLYINARARDMILVNAENVSPTEVEYAVESHPEVVEAAVLAVDDQVTGDAVCAVVVCSSGASLTARALSDWCRKTLAHYKVPTQWHFVEAALPRTASGKLTKDAIRAWVVRGANKKAVDWG
jgi:acyl-CoA synthetase (AMP-forming)/AMP-acid ligase II